MINFRQLFQNKDSNYKPNALNQSHCPVNCWFDFCKCLIMFHRRMWKIVCFSLTISHTHTHTYTLHLSLLKV